jgi:hypothetical protein
LLWWNNADGAIAGVPLDVYWANGLKDSLIVVVPSLDLVAARAGAYWAPLSEIRSAGAEGESDIWVTVWADDGQTIHLVFSGEDRFKLRKARLTVKRG